jgi:hypothetical protein
MIKNDRAAEFFPVIVHAEGLLCLEQLEPSPARHPFATQFIPEIPDRIQRGISECLTVLIRLT